MKRNILFTLIVFVTLLNVAAKQPNVIVILADDIGLGDISYYRQKHSHNIVLETPNIDQLAEAGMIFTNAHSPAALCAPSRYAIMTGNNCYRSPFRWGVWGAYEKSPINPNQLTLGKLMKQSGYQTAFFGKWHIGGDYRRKDDSTKIYRGNRAKPELDVDITKIVGGGPQQNGFDYSFTLPAGIQDVPYAVYENSVWMPLAANSKIGYISQKNMSEKEVKLDKMEGLGDLNWDPHNIGPLLVNKAVNYINRHANKKEPFFMYYCTQAVHLPHTPPKELNGVNLAGTTPRKHIDMIKELDVQMGMLIEALKKQSIYENTLLIFTSDNGGLTSKETLMTGHSPSDIYRGGKNSPYEGGHRVPFIAVWPQKIKKGQATDEPILGLDIMATLAAITKQDIPDNQAMDSYNILPILKGQKQSINRRYILLQAGTGQETIIIEGDWKLIVKTSKTANAKNTRIPLALFNLKKNPSEIEKQNLIHAKEHQERIRDLLEQSRNTRDSSKRTNVH